MKHLIVRIWLYPMKIIRAIAWWIVWNVPVGKAAPILFGFALNCKPVKKPTNPKD